MTKTIASTATFNLWTEDWITLQRLDGSMQRCGIEDILLHAHEVQTIFDPSPLVEVGIHRLLTAIAQAIIAPEKGSDIKKLWQDGVLPPAKVTAFGKEYGHRFDLFSVDEPFMQSADLHLTPDKDDKLKTAGYLLPDIPSGTEITHYKHINDDDIALCPACTAAGLITIPAFATSGGAGIKPSINGVPPIYIIPGGESLFQSIVLSLVSPEYKPTAASTKADDVWWLRKPPVVGKSKELYEVGYLHSLTFPARRVRLHPLDSPGHCTRCGQQVNWRVRTMVFEMGESRPKEPAWFDPFAAYRITEDKPPSPVRPLEGKALWREFASLFLQNSKPATSGKKKASWTQRPRVLDQMANLHLGTDVRAAPFRCVGLRTDMKAKIYEWVDAGFQVPPAVLSEPAAGIVVRDALNISVECAGIISRVFGKYTTRPGEKAGRYAPVRARMMESFWGGLADPFRQFVLECSDMKTQDRILSNWLDTAIRSARHVFATAMEGIGDDAEALRQRVQAESACNYQFRELRKKQEGGTHS